MLPPVLHFEVATGKTACGRSLPTAGYFTDDQATFEEPGTPDHPRCKSCWRIVSRDWSLEGR